MFKTVSNDIETEIVEKKSRFIANIFHVESVEEAEQKILEVKKKYFDARHNCYAYSIYSKSGNTNKFSDDGEPSGTAGAPMLNILVGQNISNCVVIVTRYFGGILLGTGGLVRAYTQAVQEGLNNIEVVEKELGIEVDFKITYPDFEKFKYYLRQNDINLVDSQFSSEIIAKVEMTEEKLSSILNKKEELNFDILDYKVVKEKYI